MGLWWTEHFLEIVVRVPPLFLNDISGFASVLKSTLRLITEATWPCLEFDLNSPKRESSLVLYSTFSCYSNKAELSHCVQPHRTWFSGHIAEPSDSRFHSSFNHFPWTTMLTTISPTLIRIFLTVCIASSTLRSFAQAPPENWLLPAKQQIVRDQAALATISASLAAMNPQSLPVVKDHTIRANVTKWGANQTSGTLTEVSIGATAQSVSVSTVSGAVYHSLRVPGSETHESGENKSVTVNDERSFEQIPYLPEALLQEVLTNPLDGLESLPGEPSEPNADRVRIKIRPAYWHPSMRDSASASFDLFFTKDTHYLKKVRGVKHFDGNLRHFVLYETTFKNYSPEAGRILPHTIEENQAGTSINEFSITSISVNQGLIISSLQ